MKQNDRSTSAMLKLIADVLEKKKEALGAIYSITENQNTVLENPRDSASSASFFREMANEKQTWIDEVLKCDDVFQSLFDEVKDVFNDLPPKYNGDIQTLQTLIREITNLDVGIRNLEILNKARYQSNVAVVKNTTPSQVIPGEAKKNEILAKYGTNSTSKKKV